MTDNEIVKALECLRGKQIFCRDCKYSAHLRYRECQQAVANDVFDLINRQKAEIERLESEIDKQYEQAKADILGNMADGGTSCHWCIEEHCNRAVKEYAERLKETKFKHGNDYIIYADNIDKLVGDNNVNTERKEEGK